MSKIRLVISFVFALGLYVISNAQVQIAPVAIYMDEENKTGRIVVRNSSNTAVEMNIDLYYGYPATNDKGQIYLKVLNDVPASEPSAAKWIRIYPRQLILPPGVQQTIRFAARPPQNLPVGEYWVRPAIVVKSLDTESRRVNSDITTKINTIKRTFLSLNYRNGEVKTGIEIIDLNASIADGEINVAMELVRKGNAAYLGQLDIQIFDATGKLIKRSTKEIAVYHTLNPIETFSVQGLSKGKYTVKVILDTSNRVEMNQNILKASRASKITGFEVR